VEERGPRLAAHDVASTLRADLERVKRFPCSCRPRPSRIIEAPRIAHAKDPQTLPTLQAARSAGGRAPRVNVQVGLPATVAEAIDLRDSAGQLAI
jgi:hypothetical protein